MITSIEMIVARLKLLCEYVDQGRKRYYEMGKLDLWALYHMSYRIVTDMIKMHNMYDHHKESACAEIDDDINVFKTIIDGAGNISQDLEPWLVELVEILKDYNDPDDIKDQFGNQLNKLLMKSPTIPK